MYIFALETNSLKPEDIEYPEGDIKALKRHNASKVFSMYQNEKPERDIVKFIEIRLADVFHKLLKEE
jgi:hypothetical protein